MRKPRPHSELHVIDRLNWLRAAVLGANDGIISTASLIVGVAAATAVKHDIIIAGIAGLVAGAMSMAAGEYVSVSAQSDSEEAELERERRELRDYPESELAELTKIYENRGLTRDLAKDVAVQLTEHDALGAHMRDELNITDDTAARPVQAAFASGVSFAIGAAFPLIVAIVAPGGSEIIAVGLATVLTLALLGGIGARVGRSGIIKGATRVVFWGILAMVATAIVGALFGTVVA
jgi:VIT1/CCC1 family predicted Fe2+/Mn2+ transporter